MAGEPLDEIQWKSPEWIQQFGLHSENVLDYFSESPFYDRTSNNQVVKMQFQFQAPPPNVNPRTYIQEKLLEMVGVEFVVAHVKEPDFWIIRKQKRNLATAVSILQDYYVIGANIYQAPKIHDILSTRLTSSIKSVKNSLEVLQKISKFDIANGGHSYITGSESGDATGGGLVVGGSGSNGISSAGTNNVANTVTPMTQTPSIQGGAIPGTTMNINTSTIPAMANSTLNNISSGTFDSLLSNIVNTSEQGTYLDDIPLYGKGSTVDAMDLRINLEE